MMIGKVYEVGALFISCDLHVKINKIQRILNPFIYLSHCVGFNLLIGFSRNGKIFVLLRILL
jgi:hypothetical protein